VKTTELGCEAQR